MIISVKKTLQKASRINLGNLKSLPAPVQRYFKYVLTNGQPYISQVNISQKGVLRTATDKERWLSFNAQHTVNPADKSFEWSAQIKLWPGFWISIRDRYLDGVGSGQIKLWSIIPVTSDAGHVEINSGELHRYLAEGVWYPTALLPASGLQEPGVTWTAIDDEKALASLTVNNITVELEFTFNQKGEVVSVYTDGRYGQFGGGYQKKPWQGHFRDYHEVNGMKVPRYGEVGWWVDGKFELVWRGDIVGLEYLFSSSQ